MNYEGNQKSWNFTIRDAVRLVVLLGGLGWLFVAGIGVGRINKSLEVAAMERIRLREITNRNTEALYNVTTATVRLFERTNRCSENTKRIDRSIEQLRRKVR